MLLIEYRLFKLSKLKQKKLFESDLKFKRKKSSKMCLHFFHRGRKKFWGHPQPRKIIDFGVVVVAVVAVVVVDVEDAVVVAIVVVFDDVEEEEETKT